MMNKDILPAIRATQGRFFGLYTKDGRAFNARLIRETPKGIRFFDRNRNNERLVTKNNIRSIHSRGRTVTTA